MSCPLYGGCPLFGGSIIRGFTVYGLYITVLIQFWQILVMNLGMTKPGMRNGHSCFNLVWVVASFPGILIVHAVFYRLQYTPGPFYHIKDVSVYIEGGGVPYRKNKLEALSYSFCPKHWSFLTFVKRKMYRSHAQNTFFQLGTPPPLCLPR